MKRKLKNFFGLKSSKKKNIQQQIKAENKDKQEKTLDTPIIQHSNSVIAKNQSLEISQEKEFEVIYDSDEEIDRKKSEESGKNDTCKNKKNFVITNNTQNIIVSYKNTNQQNSQKIDCQDIKKPTELQDEKLQKQNNKEKILKNIDEIQQMLKKQENSVNSQNYETIELQMLQTLKQIKKLNNPEKLQNQVENGFQKMMQKYLQQNNDENEYLYFLKELNIYMKTHQIYQIEQNIFDKIQESKQKSIIEICYLNDFDHLLNICIQNTDKLYDLNDFVRYCKTGNFDAVYWSIQNGVNIELLDYDDKTGLMRAVQNNHINIVDLLLKNGSDVNTQDIYQTTALMTACTKGHLKIVKKLLHYKALVNLKNHYGYTAFIFACRNKREEIIKILLCYNIDVTQKKKLDQRYLTGYEILKERDENMYRRIQQYINDNKIKVEMPKL